MHSYELVSLKMEQPNRPFSSPVSHLFELVLDVCVKQLALAKTSTCSVVKAAGAGLEEMLAAGTQWCS